MAVVVRNETSGPIPIPGRSNENWIAPGQSVVLSEEEFSRISFDKRGPGKLYAVYPNEATGETLQQKLEYYTAPGASVTSLRYLGMAKQGSSVDDTVWTIRRFSHTIVGTDVKVTDIQCIEAAAWSNRAGLPWAT